MKGSSAALEIKITTTQKMGYAEKFRDLHSGNRLVSKRPHPGREGWHASTAWQRGLLETKGHSSDS